MDGSDDPLDALDDDGDLAVLTRTPQGSRGLRRVESFGANPGALRMNVYCPRHVSKTPPLVVVLHGCLQTAEGYDMGSGWSKLADRGGFILLYPEQQRGNNSRNCFNWFEPSKVKRGGGEVRSIRNMIAKVATDYNVDRERIFICGLSAGGAMTGAMLATYPEIFRAGAIIAGLPYGGASNIPEAIESMYVGRLNAARTWGDLVRGASPHRGPWPNVSVWHGAADSTVKPINAGEIIKQWTDVHALGSVTPQREDIGAITRRCWRDPQGKARVLEYSILGLGHGTPLGGLGDVDDGVIGPFFLPTGLWSSLRIAQDWGLFDSAGQPMKPKRFSLFGFDF